MPRAASPNRRRGGRAAAGSSRFAHARRYGSRNDRRAVSVADVVLNYKHRAQPALLRPDHGRKIGVKNVAPLYPAGISVTVTVTVHLPLSPFQIMLFAAVRDYVSIPARSGISVFILAPGRAFLNNFFKKRAAGFYSFHPAPVISLCRRSGVCY